VPRPFLANAIKTIPSTKDQKEVFFASSIARGISLFITPYIFPTAVTVGFKSLGLGVVLKAWNLGTWLGCKAGFGLWQWVYLIRIHIPWIHPWDLRPTIAYWVTMVPK
jgi:hypothetical protein